MTRPHEVTDDVDGIIADAKSIMACEMRKLRQKSRRNEQLTLSDALTVRHYVGATLKIASEERAIDDFKRISSLSDEEIKILTAKIVKDYPMLKELADGAELAP